MKLQTLAVLQTVLIPVLRAVSVSILQVISIAVLDAVAVAGAVLRPVLRSSSVLGRIPSSVPIPVLSRGTCCQRNSEQ
jgi:hypothetical protein